MYALPLRKRGLFAGVLFAILSLTFSTTHAADLPPAVQTALNQARIPLDSIGVEVREISTRDPLLSVNAQRPMNPASTMKLVTTYAALDLLGPAYTWKTEAWLDGTLKDGVLQGNLVLKGYGNPHFTIDQFWLWLGELRARGLREIRGDVILDRSFFDLPVHDPGIFDNDPARAYNVGPDALLLNFNAVHLHYLPDGDTLRVYTDAPLEGIRLDNRITLRAKGGNCDDWNAGLRIQANDDAIILQGEYPQACGEHDQNLSTMSHTRYVEAMFRALWKEHGGTLSGKVRDGKANGTAQLFAVHRSEPLSEVIRGVNKFSNNVMARQIFLTLGTADRDPQTAASLPRSIRAVQDWAQRKQLNLPDLVMENGSGLSRVERISPTSMANLLQSAAAHSYSAELQASLPIPGVDGTMKKRLRDSAASGRAHLKTGTLEDVKAIAGYVRSRNGKEWVVVFFINHPNAKRGAAALDALVEWVADR
jgi:D-alanyl-D-alanine carboxypeptidase/D-alanyl-D-alanine-endopeptidase (penicillin-binding protein 4)